MNSELCDISLTKTKGLDLVNLIIPSLVYSDNVVILVEARRNKDEFRGTVVHVYDGCFSLKLGEYCSHWQAKNFSVIENSSITLSN